MQCSNCHSLLGEIGCSSKHTNGTYCSAACADISDHLFLKRQVTTEGFNEPQHYHKHNIDTIKFLQEGFPPDVFMGFAIGHIIKYAQRANYKNGREDFVKMVDYAKRALDWYDKTHS